MKNLKIIGPLVSFCLLSLGLFFMPASASALSNQDLSTGPYKFDNSKVITGTLGSQTYKFLDKDINDSIYNFAVQGGNFCNLKGVKYTGITFDSNPADGGSTATGKIILGVTSSNGINCDKLEADNIKVTNAGSSGSSSSQYQWNKDNIESLDGKTVFKPFSPGSKLYGVGTSPGSCGNPAGEQDSGQIILLDSAGGNSGTYYQITNENRSNGLSGGDDVTKKWPELAAYFSPNTCWDLTDIIKGGILKPQKAVITGSQGAASSPVGSTTDSGNSGLSAGDSCAQNNVFAWVICPMLDIAQKGSNILINLFEGQLSFTVNDLGTGSGGSNNVHTAWSLIRTISSIALVVVMLVMVLSQATSWGSIDAYTVRKMLPRLVVAVVLIQLSWNMFGFMLTVVNSVSKGLADLMYYPFGGSANMDLGSLLYNANVGRGDINSDTWAVGLVGVGIISTVLGVAAAPAVLAAAVTASFALLTGLVALMFRKILIIACLIFSPLALLLWILPGTQKYWKIWWDNFTKALMMFPIVVAIVASGRIFAWVAGTQKTSAHFSVLLNFIIIMVGYFGPLFILPKTFKWGGSLMNSAGSTITNAIKPLSSKTSKGFEGMGERWQGKGGKKYDPNASTLSRGLRRIQSGHIMPPLPGLKSASERSRRLTIAAGDKWAGERNEEAQALVNRTYEKALAGYMTADLDENSSKYKKYKMNAEGDFLDANDNIVEKKKASFDLVDDQNQAKYKITGVAAGKQALVDIAGNEGTSDAEVRAAQAAVKQLLDTSSWIEMQSARITGGKNKGKRVSEMGVFKTTLSNSPPHYSATIKSRPDMAPDVIESAEKKVGVTYQKATEPEQIAKLDKLRLTEAIDRLTPEALSQAHYGFFQDIEKLNDAELSGALLTRMQTFMNSGQVGRNAVGSLRGAEEEYVNGALRAANPNAPPQLGAFFGDTTPPTSGNVPRNVTVQPSPGDIPEDGIDLHPGGV